MTSFSGAPSQSSQQIQIVAITKVDLLGLVATGLTRQQTTVTIDLRYLVGAVHVIPSVGDQWIVRRFANLWILVSQLPYNGTELTAVADSPQQGTVQIGSTNPQGVGPLHLNGSVVKANAPVQFNSDTLYQDVGGVLKYSTDNGTTWHSVDTGTGGSTAVTWDDVEDKPTVFPTDWTDVSGKPTTFPSDWNTTLHIPTTFPPTPPTGTPDGTKFWADNNTWKTPPTGGGGGGGGYLVVGEGPGGTINGSTTVFTLAQAYQTHTTMVYINGVRQRISSDYTESSSTTITFVTAPESGDQIAVDYVVPGITNLIVGETPSGTQNGSNITFTMAHNYQTNTISVFRNGLREQISVGYTESSASTIAFTTAPLSSDVLLVDYLAQ